MILKSLYNKNIDFLFEKLYGNDNYLMNYQKKRYDDFFRTCSQKLGEGDSHLFSVPGRIEIGGNHTDHNHGKVIAASVNLDAICCSVQTFDNNITLFSQGYNEPFSVDITSLNPVKKEKGTTSALIRGICAGFNNYGLNIGGFTGFMTSDVMTGSGLSSSAVVEVLIGKIISVLFNNDSVDPVKIAKIGQFAENGYFGKPCGLMDQTACSVGGIVSIDFNNPNNPNVKKVDFSFSDYNYKVLVVNTGGSHADLTDDYASIPKEMKSVANFFNKKVLREISLKQVISNADRVRSSLGDRALLRAYHFFMENERVNGEVDALEKKDVETFLQLVTESGNSSYKCLQNIFSTHNVKEQGISLALALTEDFIKRVGKGACRVHGGGFAGTILVFLHESEVQEYTNMIEHFFHREVVYQLRIRQEGGLYLNSFLTE